MLQFANRQLPYCLMKIACVKTGSYAAQAMGASGNSPLRSTIGVSPACERHNLRCRISRSSPTPKACCLQTESDAIRDSARIAAPSACTAVAGTNRAMNCLLRLPVTDSKSLWLLQPKYLSGTHTNFSLTSAGRSRNCSPALKMLFMSLLGTP